MAMDDLDLFPYHDVAEEGEEGEDGWKGGRSVKDQKRHMVDLDAIRKPPYPFPVLIGMRDNDNFMTTVDQLRRKVIYVALDSSRLWKEEVADHSNSVRSVRHRDGWNAMKDIWMVLMATAMARAEMCVVVRVSNRRTCSTGGGQLSR